MNRIAIVIVTFNSDQVIGPCLDSCLAAGAPEIIVVDNASEDRTCAEVRRRPGVALIENDRNLGFAAAANQGIAAAGRPLALLLNPDTELLGGLKALAGGCEQPGVGAACGLLVGFDGSPQTGFNIRRLPSALTLVFENLGLNRFWPANPVNRRYRCEDLDVQKPAIVEQPAGAFLLVRRETWRLIGGFDESFHPVWFEDVDFCKRVLEAGFTIQYVPSAKARHLGGHSLRHLSFACRQVYWYASLLKYASKHLTRWQNIWVSGSVMLGLVPRVIAGMFMERSLQPIAVFVRVIRLAAANLAASRSGETVNSPISLVKSRRGTRVAQNLNN